MLATCGDWTPEDRDKFITAATQHYETVLDLFVGGAKARQREAEEEVVKEASAAVMRLFEKVRHGGNPHTSKL